MSNLWLAVRSVVWALLLPGALVLYIPWRYFGVRNVRLEPGNPLHALGILFVVVGGALMLGCIWEFARRGRGTLSPADPPRRLVIGGLYRLVRNPMYLSGTLILLGEALLTGSRALLLYWAIWFAAANLFVIFYEEPTLRRQFGSDYDRYRQQTGRWIPRRSRASSPH